MNQHPDRAPLVAERKVAHYNLLEKIGEGQVGEVYRARDTKYGRTVALKLIRPTLLADPAHRTRFLEDAAAAAKLSHPNIATLFDVGEADGETYVAYEYATGGTLRQEMRGQPMLPRRAVELAVQLSDAVADAHASGLLHGDLRPDTIFVTAKGNAKILEFGMSAWTRGGHIRARATASPEETTFDMLPVVAYMSPEEVLGGGVNPRSDVFSLGVIVYQMLTGRNPFAARSSRDTLVNIMSASVQPPSSVQPDVTSDLDALVLRALSKEIERRPQSAVALAAELRSVGAVLDVRTGDTSQDYVMPLDDEGSTGMWWVLALVAIAAGVAAWYFWFRG